MRFLCVGFFHQLASGPIRGTLGQFQLLPNIHGDIRKGNCLGVRKHCLMEIYNGFCVFCFNIETSFIPKGHRRFENVNLTE